VFAQILLLAISIGIPLDPGEHKVRPYELLKNALKIAPRPKPSLAEFTFRDRYKKQSLPIPMPQEFTGYRRGAL
jgi:hypothetical protein